MIGDDEVHRFGADYFQTLLTAFGNQDAVALEFEHGLAHPGSAGVVVNAKNDGCGSRHRQYPWVNRIRAERPFGRMIKRPGHGSRCERRQRGGAVLGREMADHPVREPVAVERFRRRPVEERMRGWLAVIAKERTPARQVIGYRELIQLFAFYQEFEIVPFDEAAAQRFEELRSQRHRLGTMDLKIAAIALTQSATLLSANLRDFERVPALRVENWLD